MVVEKKDQRREEMGMGARKNAESEKEERGSSL